MLIRKAWVLGLKIVMLAIFQHYLACIHAHPWAADVSAVHNVPHQWWPKEKKKIVNKSVIIITPTKLLQPLNRWNRDRYCASDGRACNAVPKLYYHSPDVKRIRHSSRASIIIIFAFISYCDLRALKGLKLVQTLVVLAAVRVQTRSKALKGKLQYLYIFKMNGYYFHNEYITWDFGRKL